MNRRTVLILGIAIITVFGTTSCDGGASTWFGGAAESIGLSDPKPLPPILIDCLCDSSDGASCTAATLRELIDNTLPAVAERPGSILRIWSLGEDLGTTTLVAATVNRRRATLRGRAERAAQARFVADETLFLMKAAVPIFSAARPRKSPIAEGIARIALAHAPPSVGRLYIVISDALEFSSFGEFECGELPEAGEWSSRLTAAQVIMPNALRNVTVSFAHVTPVSIDRPGCPKASLARFGQVRSLWMTSLKAAGASRVVFETGALDINDYIERSHATTGGAL